MPVLPENLRAKIVNKVALGGMNTFDDPKDLADQECSDIVNMIMDNGVIYPRGGSYLYRSKPENEDADPFQMLVATNSDGTDFMIVNYGVNFYLDDTINDQWIWLNPSGGYTPVSQNLYYGSTPWNNGITDDRFYFCNGKDPVIKWTIALNNLAIAAAAADTTLTLNDAVRFPSSGKVIVMGSTGEFILTYSTKSGNVLNLDGTVGQIVPIGSSVTIPIVSVPDVDQQQGTVNDSTPVGEADSSGEQYKLAQSFIPDHEVIDGVIFNKQSDTGLFRGDLTVALQADAAGAPSGIDLQYATLENSDWLSRGLGLQGVNFKVDQPIEFTPSPNSSNLNDMTQEGNFTGTIDTEFLVIIDSIEVPARNEQTFVPGAPNPLNDGVYDTTAYSGAPGVLNEYRTIVVADFTILLATTVPPYQVGEVIVGGTSGAQARIVANIANGGNRQLGVVLISGVFQAGENITGQSSGAVTAAIQTIYQSWIQYFANGVLTTITNGPVTGTCVPLFTVGAVTLTDGLTITFANYFGHAIGDTFVLTIVTHRPDTFQWFLNGVLQASLVPITGLAQFLADGISIKFTNTSGHTLTDSWNFFYQYNKVTPGNTYWLVFRTTTADTANHPNLGINTAGGYASGGVSYNNTPDGWVGIPTIDLYFFILSTPYIPRGKILKKSMGRLFLFNSEFAENTYNYSQINDPENFTINDTVDTGGFYTVYHGKGGIVNVDDFGEYFVIEKQNDLLKVQFVFNSTNTAFIVQVTPIISGESIGPVTNATALNYMNTLYYCTEEEGIISFAPQATGNQTTAGLKLISQKINNYVTQVLNFANSRCAGWNQKLFWITAVPLIIGLPADTNNGVIMYDLIREVWTRFDNWNAADIKPVNNVLYYFSLNDGAVYRCFVDYQDAVSDQPYPYDASFTTKRFDLDLPYATGKQVYVYLQGYINLSSRFWVDVMYNENGSLGKQTYLIDGANEVYVQRGIQGGLGVHPFAIPLLGGFNLRTMQSAVRPAFFRVYLELSQAFRAHNITIKCYSFELGSEWGVNNLTLLSLGQKDVPTQLVISPAEEPPIVL